jgi:hypothetical protein
LEENKERGREYGGRWSKIEKDGIKGERCRKRDEDRGS